MLLRGFAIPHGRSLQTAKLIIMMEALHPQSDVTDMRLQERYHLTDREQTVLIYLIQGLTSKEIGNWMDVSEHTIKEHLKHLMKKTHTTTRMGLMAKIVFAAAVPPSPGLPHALHITSAETGRKASWDWIPNRCTAAARLSGSQPPAPAPPPIVTPDTSVISSPHIRA